MDSRKRLAWILGLGLILVLGALFLQPPAEELIEVGDLQPPGRWHFQAPRLAGEEPGEDLARVLSLPYVSGTTAASADIGVTRHDTERAVEGLNLYVSGHAPEALLIDMEGKPVHRWHYAFEDAFPDLEATIETTFLRRAHLYPNGDLLAIFQGGGMIKLDRDSHLLWTSDLPYYNHLSVDEDGQVLAIAKTAKVIPELRPDTPILEDSIVWLSPAGDLIRRVSLLDCFSNSAFADSIHPLPDHADIFHTNTVLPIVAGLVGRAEIFRRGLLIVSLREIDTVAFIDPERVTVEAAWRGPWRAQHQPVPLPTGTVLLFDNKGAAGGSRVVEFEPTDGKLSWIFPGDQDAPISSPEAGSSQRLANGNTLITESEMGRAFEITVESQVVWEFFSPHRAGEKQELVATLFEVVRFPTGSLPFVEGEPDS